ncbi:MAG TPA: cupin domain-containing protein [Candidatus Dormibacteraeota bacterium]
MRVIRAADALSGGEPAGRDNFSGDAELRSIARAEQPAGVAVVTFHAGAVNNWHVHEGGQVLYVINGRGRAQAEGEEVVGLEPGDFVVIDPGEKHWHGAAAGEDMAHISVAIGAIEWFARVEV